MNSPEQGEASKPRTEKQYHTKRPHRKSRAGCRNCKARKVKCDEGRPACRACTLRKEDCTYPSSPSPRGSSAAALSVSRRQSPGLAGDHSGLRLLEEPLFMSADKDATDMKLLWFYTTQTFESFAPTGGSMDVDDILRIRIVQHAFQVPFLMNTILGLSAMHLKYLNQSVSPARNIAYRARAFQGYRSAVEEANPATFPALLACSLFLCALTTDEFRSDDGRPLYIVEWMTIWKGINLIIKMVKERGLWDSGLLVLFFRPPIDLNEAALHIPSNLLFMVTSIKEDDPDFKAKSTYYTTLKYMGSLYQELPKGFSPILALRILTYFTFLSKDFFTLAQERRPRALVIIAHYLAFAKIVSKVWWMEGISDREICNICHLLDEEWQSLLRVPRKAVHLTNKAEIARLLLDNHTWEPPSDASKGAGSAANTMWIDDQGKPLKLLGELVHNMPVRSRRRTVPDSPEDGLAEQDKRPGGQANPFEDDSGSISSGQSPESFPTRTPSADSYGF